MPLITLSQNELNRLEAIQKIRDRRLSVVQAAEVLNLSFARQTPDQLMPIGRSGDGRKHRDATFLLCWQRDFEPGCNIGRAPFDGLSGNRCSVGEASL